MVCMRKLPCKCVIVDGVIKKQCKRCYDMVRRAKNNGPDWKYKPLPGFLTSEQEQVLIGGLLGDFYLYPKDRHYNAGISSTRAATDKPYMEYEYAIFKEFCSDIINETSYFDRRTNKTYERVFFRTRVSEVFTAYKDKWYPNGEKIVPRDLKLTPLICAIWFCDDGSIYHYGKGVSNRRISIYTDNFI